MGAPSIGIQQVIAPNTVTRMSHAVVTAIAIQVEAVNATGVGQATPPSVINAHLSN